MGFRPRGILPPVRRGLLHFLAGLSLLLCLAVTVCAVRSLWVADRFAWMIQDYQGNTRTMCWTRLWINRGHAGFERERRDFTYNPDAPIPDLRYYRHRPPPTRGNFFSHESMPAIPVNHGYNSIWNQLGFVGRRVHSVSPSMEPPPGQEPMFSSVHNQRLYAAPIWPLAMLLALHPALWWTRTWRRARDRRRVRAGLCGRCGYDLRASPGRCPECGAGLGPAAGALPRLSAA